MNETIMSRDQLAELVKKETAYIEAWTREELQGTLIPDEVLEKSNSSDSRINGKVHLPEPAPRRNTNGRTSLPPRENGYDSPQPKGPRPSGRIYI